MFCRTLLLIAAVALGGCDSGNGASPPPFSVRDADGSITPAASPSPLFPQGLAADNLPVWNGYLVFSNTDADRTDNNSAPDVFMHYLAPFSAGFEISRVSNVPGPTRPLPAANAASGRVSEYTAINSVSLSSMSVDTQGQCVAFVSDASDLVTQDNNGLVDVFLTYRPVTVGEMFRVSEYPLLHTDFAAPSHSPSVNDNCGVAFVTTTAVSAGNDSNGVEDVYFRSFDGAPVLVSKTAGGAAGNGPSFSPIAIQSAVFFLSWASNLVTNDTNNALDLFRYDLISGAVTRVSVGSNGTQADLGIAGAADFPQTVFPAVRFDVTQKGRFIAFLSPATNLVSGDDNNRLDAFLHDTVTHATVRISANPDTGVSGATDDGVAVGSDYGFDGVNEEFTPRAAFVSDQPLTGTQSAAGSTGPRDVYLRDITGNTLRRLSHSGSGNLMHAVRPQISQSGGFVYFSASVEASPGNFIDLFLKNGIGP